jgi:ABC-type branched-subunit amino acid transport system permease subunit
MSELNQETHRIGTDEWVAQVEGRREEDRGVGALLQRIWRRMPPAARLALFVVPAAVFPFVANSGDVYRYGIITLLYAMLALGLNTVVGFAGILDLGYMAFFGFGAYAFGYLASQHSGHHARPGLAILLVVVMTAALGLLLGLPSRRLIGDYLAIVTLFFGQAFVVFVNNADRIDFPRFGQVDLTGGPNGLTDIDPLSFFGIEITSTDDYYYFSLIALVVVITMLHFVSESRTGRAWRALREDPLAAEAMSIPVNRLKLLAFAFGAAIAGFVGTIYGSVQTGAFPGDFDVALLITIYAIVILGGAGSLAGVVVAAIIVQGVPELLRTPETARWLFYGAILVGLLATLRPWWRLVGVLVALVAFGFAVHALAEEFWPRWTAREIEDESALASFLESWMLLPSEPKQIANWAYVALIAAFLTLTTLGTRWRTIALVPTLYLAAFVWENLLIQEVAGATPLILLGALLIVLMNARPQGLFGTARVEIV